MEGVILFVDDKIDGVTIKNGEIDRTLENRLFEDLKGNYPILGVKNLELAKQVVNSVGSFSAIILDWIFDDRDELSTTVDDPTVGMVQVPRDGSQTLEFLKSNEFYSLVYIFSNEDIRTLHGKELRRLFPKRIKFRKKTTLRNSADRIVKDIQKWRENHENLSIPTVWTSAVNQAFQRILFELSNADKNWVREIGISARDDGENGETFVIEILQTLLSESLVQNKELIALLKKEIDGVDDAAKPESEEKAVSKLFRRLYYTKLSSTDAPVMTGDICNLGNAKYGIIISPECDIKKIIEDKSRKFDLLVFSLGAFNESLKKDNSYDRTATDSDYDAKKQDTKEKLKKRFNNDLQRVHILPSFPVKGNKINCAVLTDFSLGCDRYSYSQIKNKRSYKLNSPFIQQLRQRYLSYLGRVGTPSLPESVRNTNLR